jgi:hypothetical protein
MIVGFPNPLLGLREKLIFVWIKGMGLKMSISFLVIFAPEVLLDLDHGIIHFFPYFILKLMPILLSRSLPI